MNTSDQIKAFRTILLQLFRQHEIDVRTTGNLYPHEIERKFNPIKNSVYTSDELETLLPAPGLIIQGNLANKFLCLPVPKHGTRMYPYLATSYNFGCNIPELAIRVGLMFIDSEDNSEVKGFGFRLDSPHGKSHKGGIHHFYHMQTIHSIAGTELPFADKLRWISESEPSMPLDAKCSIELLLTLIAGLYGRVKTLDFVRDISDPDIKKNVRTVLASMKLAAFEKLDLRWFWKYESANGNAVYYQTNQQQEAFHEHFKNIHQNHSLIAIMPEEYFDQPTGKRNEYILEA